MTDLRESFEGLDDHAAMAPPPHPQYDAVEPLLKKQSLRIAMLGTRGVPAAYGGFETAVEEIGRRLVQKGHDVVVYCRGDERRPREHLGMRLVHLPAVRQKALETLSHSAASTAHLLAHDLPDAAVVFNAANSPVLPILRARGVPLALHMDGLEWKRDKWAGAGRRYYRVAEQLGVRWADVLIADAQGIADYYRDAFGAQTRLITYGAPILGATGTDRLATFGVHAGQFHLVVARFEPENHVDVAVRAAQLAQSRYPLLVVGSAPYSKDYVRLVRDLAGTSDRVRLVGPVWDQEALDQLYAHALTYVHGHSVGGTNPSLLRAMGAGTAVLAYDVGFNREVLAGDGKFYRSAEELAPLLLEVEDRPREYAQRALALKARAAKHYVWDDVADQYEDLCSQLASQGQSSSRPSGRRLSSTSRKDARRAPAASSSRAHFWK